MKKNTILASIAGGLVFVSILSAQVPLNQSPTRVVGKTSIVLNSLSPNLAESRDLASPNSVAVDTSSSPPLLYVADTSNNRVLGWRNAAGFTNGAPADIVIGQRDFVSTLALGPGTQLQVGLNSPLSVVTDATGNLYVADGGNNRILRYPRPFAQTDDLKQPDMIIGQPNLNSNAANFGGSPGQNTLSFIRSGQIYRSALALDQAGNLWVSDSGNNRVLRFPQLALQRGLNQPGADAVLGQPGYTVNNLTPGNAANKQVLSLPSGIAFDSAGRLYVCDALARVLVYTRPVNGAIADRIMGVVVLRPGDPPLPAVNDTGIGRSVAGRPVLTADGVFAIGTVPFIIDTASNRILRFDPYESWPQESDRFSPPSRQVIGQTDVNSFKANRNLPEASSAGFDTPVSATVANNEVYVVDSGNHRVLVFPIQGNTIANASRVLGQADFYQTSPNSIDGREMWLYNGLVSVGAGASSDGAGVALDYQSNPPRMYVSDTYNHRILGYKDARNVRPGDRADIVIGQRDLTRAMINNPTNDVDQVTDNGLALPAGLAVDSGGNLYVADSGNGRILRYPRPFDQQGAVRPDLVLGQTSYFLKATDATPRNMNRPYGLAFTTQGHLLASDLVHNRVLLFTRPAGGDFTSGQAADKVFGQPDFVTVFGSNLPNRMIAPHGIATDTDDRLYVSDTGNNRVLIYDSVALADIDPFPAFPLTVSSPHGISVSPQTGELWVTSARTNLVVRFPVYLRLLLDPRADYQIPAQTPVAVAQDPGGNLVVADGANRIGFYYPGMSISNGGNQLRTLAPYTLATLRPVTGANFGDTSLKFSDLPDTPPIPTNLADLEVMVNDIPAPIREVSPSRMEIIIPKSVHPSNQVQFIVSRRSTGQIVATATATVATYAPGLITLNSDGNGQILAKNPDGVQNDPNNRVGRSEVISIFGTGFGVPAGAPEDGVAAPDRVDNSGILRVVIGTAFVPDENITYFGLAPGLVGVFQIDVKVPDTAPPDPQVRITCQFNSVACGTGDGTGVTRSTFIAVKP